jgi:hypothetical protein
MAHNRGGLLPAKSLVLCCAIGHHLAAGVIEALSKDYPGDFGRLDTRTGGGLHKAEMTVSYPEFAASVRLSAVSLPL